MAKYSKPRAGSTGYSPRVKAKKQSPSISNYAPSPEAVLQGFLAFKAGMTHILAKDLDKNSHTHNMDVQVPVTILDCPPVKAFGVRAYIQGYNGEEVLTDILDSKPDKDLARKRPLPKGAKSDDKKKKVEENMDNIIKFTLLVHTQPKKSGLKKKTPEIMELGIGGSVQDQWAYAQEQLGKEISIKDVIADSDMVDVIAVTKGKGFQGPIKRWGIKLQKRKASRGGHERHVGSIGGWKPANLSWLTPMAGQMGYHNRADFNKLVIKVGEKGEEVNPDGGFIGYGVVGGEYLLVKGSVPGPKKRTVALRKAIRPTGAKPAYSVDYVSTESQQGT